MYDVVIIGAGAAGSAAARAASLAGLSTLCVEQRSLQSAGAHWINAVPRWCFEEARVPLPEGDELQKTASRSVLVAGWTGERVAFSAEGVLDVDMRRLIQRLRDDASRAGATFQEKVSVQSVDEQPDGITVHTADGPLRARTVVDATGIRGLNLVGAPESTLHVCAAAQQQRTLTNPQRAHAFLKENGAREGENLIFTGIAGGYSVVNVCVEGDEVGLLTGSVPADGHPPGRTILETFAQEHADWIGPALRAGAGPIPLRAPLRPARGRIAALGDQGGHVYAAHGSSIGASMVGAEMLARTLAGGGTAEDWGRSWMRTYGGSFASAYLFCRFSMTLSTDELEGLMSSGLLAPDRMATALLQGTPQIRLKDLPSVLVGAFQQRRVVARLAPIGWKMGIARARYATYPGPSPRWEEQMQRLLE